MKFNPEPFIKLACAVVALLATAGIAQAEVRLANVFSDNMVLQREAKVPVWGWAAPKERVVVEFAGQKKTAVADASGKWLVKFSKMSASAEPRTLVVTSRHDGSQCQITNVLVGEVWLAGGQSNMGVQLNSAWYAKDEKAHADHPQFRYLTVAVNGTDDVQRDLPVDKKTAQPARWVVCTTNTAGNFSGVCYWFGLELQKELGVPVGIVRSSQGGTPVEAWTSEFALAANLPGEKYLAEWKAKRADPAKDRENFDARGRAAAAAAKARGKPAPWVSPYQEPATSSHRPANLYNAMIAPLAPFAFRGVIWYQGENNANPFERGADYATLFPAMIRDWRSLWKNDLPFFFVQLPNYRDYGTNKLNWPQLRESQLAALKLPKTGMAVAIDAGTPTDIHPPDKKPVGHRLALQALAKVYDRKISADGPRFKRMKLDGDKARLTFSDAEAGMVLKDCIGKKSFAMAGEDNRFFPAQALLEGDTVVVWSDEVKKPVAVRYCFINSPDAVLFGKNGLPAAPFRTDNWPLINSEDE